MERKDMNVQKLSSKDSSIITLGKRKSLRSSRANGISMNQQSPLLADQNKPF